MFGFLGGVPRDVKSKESKERIAALLKTSPEALERFEKEYRERALTDEDIDDGLFGVSAKQASKATRSRDIPEFSEEVLSCLMKRITNELVTEYEHPGSLLYDKCTPEGGLVCAEEIKAIPTEIRPQLSGRMMTVDLGGLPSYITVLDQYRRMLAENDPKKKRLLYCMFRQGLDILDLDKVMYEMLGMNPNSIGHWFPTLKEAAEKRGFFKIPETKIIKVPMPILQLSRIGWEKLTPTTLKIVDDFCMKAFDLDVSKTYFVKTGTYSSKFDFRNAKVSGEKEVRELGEYLLFIQSQACLMAGPLSTPSIYGVSTTNEWCVREFIEDTENNPTIYKGLPLRTEYRVFADFDSDEILGIAPYWRSDIMKKRFGDGSDKNSPHQIHDYVIYTAHEETLMKRYEENKDKVLNGIREMLPEVRLQGQWSIDVMQNGNDFWLIDMALAQTSALSDCIPPEKVRKMPENWLPDLSSKLEEKT